MTDKGETTVAPRPHRVHVRVRAGIGKRRNWLQLAKFCAVGGSGYAVNLCVFAFCVEVLDIHHLAAATVAFVVAVINNFWWNRHWTFDARGGRAGFQAPRFFAVSILAFLVAASVLQVLVSAGVPELLAQAIAIVVSTPLNFVGNKLWSFAIEVSRD
jgi:dolichol-phosphate mannosyltransferase